MAPEKCLGALESDNVHHLEGGENRELAVQLAQHEISRRATERKATRQAGISHDEERTRRAGRVWEVGDNREPDDLSRRLQEVRSQVERPGREVGQPSQRKDSDKTYAYPHVPLNHAMPKMEPPVPSKTIQPPNLPPKSTIRSNISAPPLPGKLSAAITNLSPPPHDPSPLIPPKLSTGRIDISLPYPLSRSPVSGPCIMHAISNPQPQTPARSPQPHGPASRHRYKYWHNHADGRCPVSHTPGWLACRVDR